VNACSNVLGQSNAKKKTALEFMADIPAAKETLLLSSVNLIPLSHFSLELQSLDHKGTQ
jgi:hypothetical protein